jgi:hypothetical protein
VPEHATEGSCRRDKLQGYRGVGQREADRRGAERAAARARLMGARVPVCEISARKVGRWVGEPEVEARAQVGAVPSACRWRAL